MLIIRSLSSHHGVHIEWISHFYCFCSGDHFFNKSIINGVVPSGHSDYKITIPIEKIYAFYLRYERSTTPKKYKSHMISHNVILGETLEDIAKQYEADKEEIKRSNHLTEDTLLVDSLLVIPVTQKVFQKISE